MNNQPAFPVFPETAGGHAAAFQGMTLRDYFAAKAMQEFIGVLNSTDGTRKAYEWADAMLKAREQ